MEGGVWCLTEAVFIDIVLIEVSDVCVDIMVDLFREVASSAEVKEVVDFG